MEFKHEQLNPCTIRVEVACGPEDVAKAFEQALKRYAKRIRVPGFRPGAAPANLIEPMIPKEDLESAAADELVRGTLTKVVKQIDVKPHDSPTVEVKSFEREPGKCEYVAKIPLAPVVELGDYTKLSAERPRVEVSDEEVENQVEEIRRRSGRRESVTDRGAQDGDVAVISLRPEDQAEGRNFMIIVGQTFPELDTALRGMVAEEMKHVKLTFPPGFQDKDWAGQTLDCHLTLRSINAVLLPELDDAFAQSLKTKNLDDLRARVREQVFAAKNNMAQEYVNDQLLDDLLSKSTVEVPDTMWEAVAARRLGEIRRDLERQGKTLEVYAQEVGMSLDQLVEAWRNEAKAQVVRAVMVNEIFRREKLKLDQRYLSEELAAMAVEYGMKPQELFEALRKNRQLHEVEFRAVYRVVMEYLNRTSNIREATIPASPMSQ